MKKAILAINKKTDQEVAFTLEQWENLERTGHAQNWKILDDSALVSESIEMVVDFEFKNWEQKLIDADIPYNKRIRDPEKLRAIYEAAKEKEVEIMTEAAKAIADEIADDPPPDVGDV